MSSVRIRRAAALGVVLAVAASGMAAADTLVADGDAVEGPQPAVHLGEASPGEARAVDVVFVLTCQGTSHVVAGTSVAVFLLDQTVPADGAAAVQDGRVDVPADWPAPGADCPVSLESSAGQPAHVELTAPTTPGTGYEFVFLFLADPGAGVTNNVAFTATLDVVADAPADTTAPILAGMPSDVTVVTGGTTAAVAWTDPTATDDTDPSPAVGCDPVNGSTFALGTTTVTCTATDDSGNAASAAFSVTVRQLTAAWGAPLDAGTVPALVGQLGRTIPLKLFVSGGVAAPALRLDRLDACATGAATLASRDGGAFRWDDGAWRLNLATGGLAAGCWRLVATSDGTVLAGAVVRLVPDTAAKLRHGRAAGRRGR